MYCIVQIAQDIAETVKQKLNNSGYSKVAIETVIGDSDGSGGSLV